MLIYDFDLRIFVQKNDPFLDKITKIRFAIETSDVWKQLKTLQENSRTTTNEHQNWLATWAAGSKTAQTEQRMCLDVGRSFLPSGFLDRLPRPRLTPPDWKKHSTKSWCQGKQWLWHWEIICIMMRVVWCWSTCKYRSGPLVVRQWATLLENNGVRRGLNIGEGLGRVGHADKRLKMTSTGRHMDLDIQSGWRSDQNAPITSHNNNESRETMVTQAKSKWKQKSNNHYSVTHSASRIHLVVSLIMTWDPAKSKRSQ
jgi:hypothetical protein